MLGHCLTNAAVLCLSFGSSLTCLSLRSLRMGQWSLTVQGQLAAFLAFPLTDTQYTFFFHLYLWDTHFDILIRDPVFPFSFDL